MLRGFKAQVVILLTILILVITGLVLHFIQFKFTSVTTVGLIALGLIIWRLFYIIDKTNHEIAGFLMNIQYNDYATSYTETESLGQSYQKLHGAFNLITKKFRDIRVEKEAQYQYLQAIVENVDTGLMVIATRLKPNKECVKALDTLALYYNRFNPKEPKTRRQVTTRR